MKKNKLLKYYFYLTMMLYAAGWLSAIVGVIFAIITIIAANVDTLNPKAFFIWEGVSFASIFIAIFMSYFSTEKMKIDWDVIQRSQ